MGRNETEKMHRSQILMGLFCYGIQTFSRRHMASHEVYIEFFSWKAGDEGVKRGSSKEGWRRGKRFRSNERGK